MTFRKRVFTLGCQDVLCVCVVESTCYSYQKMGGNLSTFQPKPPVDKNAKNSGGNLSMYQPATPADHDDNKAKESGGGLSIFQPAHPTANNTKGKESSGSGHAISKQNVSEKQRHYGLHKTLQQMCDEYKEKYMFLKHKVVTDLVKDHTLVCKLIKSLLQEHAMESGARQLVLLEINNCVDNIVNSLDKYIPCQDPLEGDRADLMMASEAIVDICLNVICTYKYLLSDEQKTFGDEACNRIMHHIREQIEKMEELLDSKCNNGPLQDAFVQCQYLHQFEEALEEIKSNMKFAADYKNVKKLRSVQVMTIIDDPKIQKEFTTLVNEMAKVYMPKLNGKTVIVEYKVDVENYCTVLRFKCKSATSRFTEMTEGAHGGEMQVYKSPGSQHENQLLMIEDSKERQQQGGYKPPVSRTKPLMITDGNDRQGQDSHTQKPPASHKKPQLMITDDPKRKEQDYNTQSSDRQHWNNKQLLLTNGDDWDSNTRRSQEKPQERRETEPLGEMIEELKESLRQGMVHGNKSWMQEFMKELRRRKSMENATNEWVDYR